MRLNIDKLNCGMGLYRSLFWDLQLPPAWNPWISDNLINHKELINLLRLCYNLDIFPIEPYNTTARFKVRR